jgi:hypothetical protein
MWDHEEGQKLLSHRYDLAVALHNISHKTKDAIKELKIMLAEDPIDHLVTYSCSITLCWLIS